MMEYKTYNLCLIGNDVRDEFLEEIKDKYSILSVPKNIPSVMIVSLTESEKEELLKHIYVMSIEEEPESYPTSTPVFTPIQFEDKTVITIKPGFTVEQASDEDGDSQFQEPGSNYISVIHKYMSNGTGITGTLGLKGDDSDEYSGIKYRSFLSGEHVDIVTFEGTSKTGKGASAGNLYHKHPEWNAIGELRSDGTITPGTDGSRCVPMDWEPHNFYFRELTQPLNINQNSEMLSEHAVGSLSCAAGQVGGLAKNASLRALYRETTSATADGCDSLIDWHNKKPTNPITGQKNPTIVLGEWQYNAGNFGAVRLIDIESFTSLDANGAVITTTRPDSSRNPPLNGWLLSDFVEKNMIPKALPSSANPKSDSGFWHWAISFDYDGDKYPANRAALQALTDAGIHFICAAGNDGGVHSKYNDQYWNLKITTVAGPYKFYDFNEPRSNGNRYKPEDKDGPDEYFYYQTRGPAGASTDQIDVAAYQPSEVTPSTNGSTVKGPIIDIFGLGPGTWTALPNATYGDGYKYGMFSGTSAAAPTVAGVAACMLEYSFLTTGSYPTPAELKSALLDNSIDRIKSYESIDWSNPSYNVTKLSYEQVKSWDDQNPTLIGSNSILELQNNNTGNTANGVASTELVGTTTRAAFLPDFMRNYFPSSQGGNNSVDPDPVPAASVPGACIPPTIKGPTNLQPSPPYNYAKAFDKYGSGRGHPDGIFFLPKGEESNYPPENISYINFRLRIRGFGPRGGDSTLYLTSNRGNRDSNKGNVRKWYTSSQDLADRDDKYTTNKGEAFVPFRIHFRLGFICGGDGDYRVLYSDHYHDWNGFEYKDIDFDSSELASQNNLQNDGSGKLIFPDFGSKNYTNPRIFQIKADIYNLDLNVNESERKNRINMFAVATDDENKAKESNILEFGKFIIT